MTEAHIRLAADQPVATSSVRGALDAMQSSVFKPLSRDDWALISQAARDEFCPWQFERLLNSAADLLDLQEPGRPA